MEGIDIIIDCLTDCLIKRRTGEKVETIYKKCDTVITSEVAKKYMENGWKFDWSIPQEDKCEVYELFAVGDSEVQGRVAFKHITEEKYTYLELIEAAPGNVGMTGKYEGVGGHLFAIVCKHSLEVGNDGYVQFEPKTKLIEYYQKKIGAKIISDRSMYVDTKVANELVNKYFRK